jgi:hypothetical protein
MISFGQEKQLDTLTLKFDQHRKWALQEKIYLHTDRTFYVTGEIMNFKVYAVEGALHKPLNISKVAYVDILDQSNATVMQAKVALENGFGSGSIFIPASLASANYIVRGYTKWMTNFDPDYYYTSQLTIINPFVKKDADKTQVNNQILIDIFPEGGNLLSGVKSKVAFKVTDASGNGINCLGSVITNHNDTICAISTTHNGMGYFYLTPQQDIVYRLAIENKNKIVGKELPAAPDFGFTLALKDSTETFVNVQVVNRIADQDPSPVYLFVHGRQSVVHAEVKVAYGKTLNFQVLKEKLRDGINHFTLFDENLNPIAERLYFKYPKDQLDIKIQTEQQQYGIRRKVLMNILSANNSQKVPGNFSVSVYKADSLAGPRRDNIYNYLILESDLKGHIENPEFYFSKNSIASDAMDVLMLTHGWRRFNWNNILKENKARRIAPEYRGHLITGVVKDSNGKPVQGSLVYLSSPDKVIRLYPSLSDANGHVKFEALDFWGVRQIIVRSANDSTHTIDISSPFSKSYTPYKPSPLTLSEKSAEAILTRSIAMQVQDIYDEKNREHYIRPAFDSAAFYGKANETYYLDEFIRFPVMEEVMREYVPGVLVRKRRDGFNFIVIDEVHETAMRSDPMILLDGVPLFDADDIMNFDPRKIRKLEVVTRPYYLGPVTMQGIVSYSTYAGDLAGFQLDPSTLKIDYEGLQLAREFYSPQYENQKQRLDRTPDHRTLLYWSPQVITDDQGATQIEFFTSDLEGNYVIDIQGITNNGIPGSSSTTFYVKRFDN